MKAGNVYLMYAAETLKYREVDAPSKNLPIKTVYTVGITLIPHAITV